MPGHINAPGNGTASCVSCNMKFNGLNRSLNTRLGGGPVIKQVLRDFLKASHKPKTQE